jgi:hypothetical protein
VRLVHRRSVQAPNELAPRRSGRDAADFAWRVHGAQESWANKADVKASILLALEGGALFAVIAANAKDGLLTRLTGWQHVAEIVGIAFLLLAVSGATIAVFPRLGRAGLHRGDYHRHIIYFGHLRYWDAAELTVRLEALTSEEELAALSQQLVQMAKSNWDKHRWVQVSLMLALLGIIMISIAAVTVF